MTSTPETDGRVPVSTRAALLSALAISSPAFVVAFALAVRSSFVGLSWIAIALVVSAAFAAGRACLSVKRAASNDAGGTSTPFAIGAAATLCAWVAPGIWIYLILCVWAWLLGIPTWSPSTCIGVALAGSFGIAVGLSYAPIRLSKLLIAGATAVAFGSVVVFSAMAVNQHRHRPVKPVTYTLDADGNPVAVAPGAQSSQSTSSGGFVYQAAASNSGPLWSEAKLVAALQAVPWLALAASEFLRSAASGETIRRPMLRLGMMSLLALPLVAEPILLAAAERVNDVSSGTSMPLGDGMSLIGAWAFGSARAGWWFMLVQTLSLGLLEGAAASICLRPGGPARGRRSHAEPSGSQGDSAEVGRFEHRRILGRAAVAAIIVATGTGYFFWLWAVLSASQLFVGVRVVPDPITVLSLAVTFAVVFQCAAWCLASLRVKNCQSAGWRRFRAFTSYCGLSISVVIGLALVVLPVVERGQLAWDLASALGVCALWVGLRYIVGHRARRAVSRAAAGLCVGCGYDLRETPDRCPECGRAVGSISAAGTRG